MSTLIPSRNLLLCVTFLYCFAQSVVPVNSANILFFFGVSGYSHRVPAWPLAEALAEKGHNVTFVSPYPAKQPNPKVHDYVPTKLKEWVDSWGDVLDVFADRKNGQLLQGWTHLPQFGITMCEIIYSDEGYRNWMKMAKFDLLLVDTLLNECAYGMAHHFGAKIILYSTTALFSWHTESFGIPDETSSISHLELFYSADMTFPQRITNALAPIAWEYYRTWTYFPKLEEITREYLGMADLPSFRDIERNISLVFLNTHYSGDFSRALPPNVIPIGGIACTGKTTKLPEDMENFLNEGNGFIYLSFGTYADFQLMDNATQDAIIGAMRSFPKIQFLWKVGNESLVHEFPDKNVYIGKWMPQQDILAHPKIRAFITHSGLISIHEAICNAVPLCSLPIFAEQDYNAEIIHRKEHGIRLEITTLTQLELQNAISKVLSDEKYRNNMKRVARAFKNRPQKPLETALWWTEYVLQTCKEDLQMLRPLSVGQSWWKRRQLDVWIAVVGTITFGFWSILFMLVKILNCALSSRKSDSLVKVKKRKTQ